MSDFNGELNKSLDDFMESYKITDTEKIYSNGMELVPIFRIKQWEEYNNQDKEIERLRLELSGYRQAILQDKEMLGLKQEIERLNKEREIDIKYNKYLQKELAKANSIINEIKAIIYNNQIIGTEERLNIKEILDKGVWKC